VAAKVRERLAINKQSAQNFDVERFNLRKQRTWSLGNNIR